MPGGDRTGPMGAGPMTGRAAGFCAGYAAPGYMNGRGGRGFGMGFGRGGGFGGGGRGWRHRFHATGFPGWMRTDAPYAQPAIGPEQEVADLKRQAEYFGNALEEIRNRIEAIEGKKAEE